MPWGCGERTCPAPPLPRRASPPSSAWDSALGIPANLKVLGVRPEDFAVMAENAMKDVCSLTNPRTATKEQIIEVYRQAYEGE